MKKISIVGMLAMIALVSLSLSPSLATEGEVQQTWVKMHGQITQWGSIPIYGLINAHARMVNTNDSYREWARVHAIWSTSLRHINCTDPPTENFTYNFYTAKLINSTIIELNYSAWDFYISGLWNVYNVTITYYIDIEQDLTSFTLTIEEIVSNAVGELRVFNNWKNFELGITGIDTLSGIVRMHAIGQMEIEICDMNGNGNVNIEDLVQVAHRYGSMPGLGNYAFEMDFNLDFKIDVGDLTTLAANIKA